MPPRLSQVRARLLARIASRYDVLTEDLSIGPLRLPITRVRDADVVLNRFADDIDREERRTGVRQDDVLHLPYWAELWDSAFGVARRVVERAIDWPRGGVSILDLGCGMGLSGTAAAAMGARVLLADLEPACLLFAAVNALPWSSGKRVRTRRLNWQTDRLGEQFDLILGADILYDCSQWPFLDVFWRAHLAEGGTVVLGEPGRQTGEMFAGWIADRPWAMSRTEVRVPGIKRAIRLFELRAVASSPRGGEKMPMSAVVVQRKPPATILRSFAGG